MSSYLAEQDLLQGMSLDLWHEREILGTALAYPDRALETLALVEPADWSVPRHRALAAAMRAVVERGEKLDVYAIVAEMGPALEAYGGVRAVCEVSDTIGDTLPQLKRYAAAIRAAAISRRMLAEWQDGTTEAVQGYTGTTLQRVEAIAELQRELDSLGDPRAPDMDDLGAWTSARYEGEAPPVSWLVPDVLARAEANLIAAPGDSGKGFITLELGLQLASGVYRTGKRAPFGRAILPSTEPCTCVLLYAEDSAAAIHRRLVALDPTGEMRRLAGDRFRAVAMPSAGGAMSVLERTPGGEFVTTARWRRMLDQLGKVQGLGLVVVDPLSCFLSLDVDSDSAVAQAAMGEMARAADVLDVAILVAHHMKKGQDPQGYKTPELPTHESVRNSIRGVAALLNGVRMAYGIVPLPGRYARAVLTKLGERGELDVGRVYWGAVVKANGKTDRRPRLYVRADYGLLEDRTADLAAMGRLDDALKALIAKLPSADA